VHSAIEYARTRPTNEIVVINVSGRGDKDVVEAIRLLELRGDSLTTKMP
jgi:tryptophan synthase beta subunit